MTRTFALLLACLALSLPACRLVSREVACNYDRDCPQDASMSYCDAEPDAGPGRCVEVDPNPAPDSGPGFSLDAGFFNPNADGGEGGEGGPPGFP